MCTSHWSSTVDIGFHTNSSISVEMIRGNDIALLTVKPVFHKRNLSYKLSRLELIRFLINGLFQLAIDEILIWTRTTKFITIEFANFTGLYFLHFTTFSMQPIFAVLRTGVEFRFSCLDQNLVNSWNHLFFSILTIKNSFHAKKFSSGQA